MAEVLCPVVVGRTKEIRALESALDDALAGRGGCVMIVGEAGIGKSRLIRELARLATERHVTVIGGRAARPGLASHQRRRAFLVSLCRRR